MFCNLRALRLFSSSLIALSLPTLSIAWAQSSEPSTRPSTGARVGAQGSAEAGGAVSASGQGSATTTEGEAPLSSEAMLSKANEILNKGRQLSLSVQWRIDEATKNRKGRGPDIILIRCLRDKQDEIDSRVGDGGTLTRSIRELQVASNNGITAKRDTEFEIIQIIAADLERLEKEVSGCIGDDPYYTDAATEVRTTVQGNMPAGQVNPDAAPPLFIPPDALAGPPVSVSATL